MRSRPCMNGCRLHGGCRATRRQGVRTKTHQSPQTVDGAGGPGPGAMRQTEFVTA